MQTVIGVDGRTVGVGVVRVSKGSGADKAGVKVGDVIISINNVRLTGTQALSEVLATLNPGDRAKVQLLRPRRLHRDRHGHPRRASQQLTVSSYGPWKSCGPWKRLQGPHEREWSREAISREGRGR